MTMKKIVTDTMGLISLKVAQKLGGQKLSMASDGIWLKGGEASRFRYNALDISERFIVSKHRQKKTRNISPRAGVASFFDLKAAQSNAEQVDLRPLLANKTRSFWEETSDERVLICVDKVTFELACKEAVRVPDLLLTINSDARDQKMELFKARGTKGQMQPIDPVSNKLCFFRLPVVFSKLLKKLRSGCCSLSHALYQNTGR